MRKVFIMCLVVLVGAFLLGIANADAKGGGHDKGNGKGHHDHGNGKGLGHHKGENNTPDDPNNGGSGGSFDTSEGHWIDGVRCVTDWERATYQECKRLPYIPAQ